MRRLIVLGLWLLTYPASEGLAEEKPAAREAYDLRCGYTARADAPNRSANQLDYDWDNYEQCARSEPDGRMKIAPAHLERVRIEDGLEASGSIPRAGITCARTASPSA